MSWADWNLTVPDFGTLPATTTAGFRWVDGIVMDEEQYRAEHWCQDPNGYWMVRGLEGIAEYAATLKRRKAERRESWKARHEEDAAWTTSVMAEGREP